LEPGVPDGSRDSTHYASLRAIRTRPQVTGDANRIGRSDLIDSMEKVQEAACVDISFQIRDIRDQSSQAAGSETKYGWTASPE
jgi:hypothetical protein